MKKNVNWEKLGVYTVCVTGFVTGFAYLADIKERIASLETKVEHHGVILERMDDTRERVTRLEVKVDHLKEKI